jgi:mono/diheme cytochrome c family protein
VVLAAAVLLAACKSANPDAAAVERGEAIVQQWCSLCHAMRGTDRLPDQAPSFEQVAKRPGRNTAYLRQFLDQDHFPMPTYRLFDTEKDDVVSFIGSLTTEGT